MIASPPAIAASAAALPRPANAAGRSLPALGRTFGVQLDGDEPLERVTNKRRKCKAPFPCSQLVLRDGNSRRTLTGISQRPRYPYYWSVRGLQFLDLTGDGRSEIIWDLATVGGTGSSPSLTGVHRWDGQRLTQIFDLRNARRIEGSYVSLYVRSEVVAGSGLLPEIEITESLHGPSDSTCCPSGERVTRYRWDGTEMAFVPGSKQINYF